MCFLIRRMYWSFDIREASSTTENNRQNVLESTVLKRLVSLVHAGSISDTIDISRGICCIRYIHPLGSIRHAKLRMMIHYLDSTKYRSSPQTTPVIQPPSRLFQHTGVRRFDFWITTVRFKADVLVGTLTPFPTYLPWVLFPCTSMPQAVSWLRRWEITIYLGFKRHESVLDMEKGHQRGYDRLRVILGFWKQMG